MTGTDESRSPSWVRRAWRTLLVVYLVAVAAAHLRHALAPVPAPPPPGPSVELRVEGADEPLRVAYRLTGPDDGPAVVLLHGSPGDGDNLRRLAEALADRYRVLVPDLPGFGDSTLDLPDTSILFHARALLALLDALGIDRAHLVGYSMGGGPALHAWDLAPARVASITMLSSIGVQEMELLGDYTMNHAVHGLQLGLARLAWLGAPVFGSRRPLEKALAYTRNFYDSDQRPLRAILERIDVPLLVAHGVSDFLVPVEAAHEHHRIVPHSELWLYGDEGPLDDGHFMVFQDHAPMHQAVRSFLDRSQAGTAPTRGEAAAARVARAAEPFDPHSVPPATGFLLVILMIVLAAATLVSEDLTCIGAGLLVAGGRLTFLPASLACLVGIVVGDMALFLAGRWLGRPAVRRAPLRWMVSPAAIERSSAWFARKGASVILASRFLPGTRLPTYFAAGLLETSLLWFAGWFLLAGVLWTPALVGLSTVAGVQLRATFGWLEHHPLAGLALAAGVVLTIVKLGLPMLTHRGRRLLRGRWLRWTRWEFWPPWLFYPPVVAWIALLMLRHRSLSLVSAANPGIPASGIIGESKIEILEHLGLGGRAPEAVARALPATTLLPGHTGASPGERLERLEAFMEDHALGFPVVLKPDAGQRGQGVLIAADRQAALDYLTAAPVDVIAQEFVDGPEFGLFYVRRPGDAQGTITSITRKLLPSVTGDGHRSLERLVLDDPRAVAMARTYLENLGADAARVPAPGERVPLATLGTHCRGAVFLDGAELVTPELTATLDRISAGFEGFHFGRYDVRVPDEAALRRGEGLRIIELNGLTSEATHIYDPRHGLLHAYGVLFRQWSLAFEIARANVERGARPTPVSEVLGQLFGFLREARRRST